MEFKYSKFFNNVAVMQILMGIANVISTTCEVYERTTMDGSSIMSYISYTENTDATLGIGLAISGSMILVSFWNILQSRKVERIRIELNTYCMIVLLLSAIQLIIYLIEFFNSDYVLIPFWVCLGTTAFSYVIIMGCYLCRRASNRLLIVRPPASNTSAVRRNSQESRSLREMRVLHEGRSSRERRGRRSRSQERRSERQNNIRSSQERRISRERRNSHESRRRSSEDRRIRRSSCPSSSRFTVEPSAPTLPDLVPSYQEVIIRQDPPQFVISIEDPDLPPPSYSQVKYL